ncbi:transmembrane protein 205 [Anthonomus grandis grandis]|uniref:transmembrane protein 205 n=1 Tax=Anthonomus grandis grandis TaxID=2921223 RepID=UPI0021669FB6|nr:transmembrane protein 205 [Anthonomus grandis grandis]
MCVGRVPQSEECLNYPLSLKYEDVPAIEEVYPERKKKPQKYENQLTQDVLAVTTMWTKDLFFSLNGYMKSISETPAYRILCQTTQPAHLVTSIAVLWIAFLCLPSKRSVSSLSPLWTLLYLGSFSAHFGAQIWMTFVSGLALYFSLPRHTFGSVQKILFPKYFLLNAFLSLITLAIFLRAKNSELRTTEIAVQAFAMSLCFLTELVIFLYLTPPLLALIAMKIEMEKDAGVGMEVGKLEPGKLLKCPHYVKIHKAFRKVHMSIAIGNIFTMACTSMHLYYLACRLCALSL